MSKSPVTVIPLIFASVLLLLAATTPLSEQDLARIREAYPALPEGIEVRGIRCSGEPDGMLIPGTRVIALCTPLPSDAAVLAFLVGHEVGHLVLGHVPRARPFDAVRQEVEADRYAARTAGPVAAAAGCRILRAALGEWGGTAWELRVRMAALGCNGIPEWR
jgi:Zn-dependent protease with chaperone function